VIDGPRIPVETTSALDAICLNILHSTFAKFTSESWPQIINPPGVGVPKIVQTIEEFGHTRYDNEVTIKENPTPQEMEIVAAVNLLRATVQRLINPPKEPVI
jgi:hypothetical protein